MDLSVIIPLYNKAPYIKRAIDSVLDQTVQATEILVVDDGSTDGGGKIVTSISDARVRLICQRNSGQHAARNTGSKEAVSSYIAFLDADDEWKPDFLNTIQALTIDFPNCGAYATSVQIIKPDGQIIYPNLVGIPTASWRGIIPNFFELFQAGFAFNSSSTVVPKTVLEKIGGFPEDATYSGDLTCWIKIALSYPIAFSSARLAIYHQESQNRLGPSYKSFLKEMPFNQIILDAIDNNIISDSLRADAFELFAQRQIWIATNNLMAGYPRTARRLLNTCKETKKYKRDWLWWRFWASFPVGWPKRFLDIKQMLFGKATR